MWWAPFFTWRASGDLIGEKIANLIRIAAATASRGKNLATKRQSFCYLAMLST